MGENDGCIWNTKVLDTTVFGQQKDLTEKACDGNQQKMEYQHCFSSSFNNKMFNNIANGYKIR